MLRFLLLAGAAFAPASALHAQTTPAPSTPSPAPAPSTPPAAADSEESVIVVRADPVNRTSIDRETYVVRDNAEARTSNALDILGRIPAVTVQPDNSVRLLGTTGVTVLIDGRPSPNPNALRDLQGSEIARIEVVSNPSAQFSASGTGGIINIITRRNALDGLRGSVTASVSRYGGFELRAAPSWTSGAWTVSGNLGWTRNGSESESIRERFTLTPPGTIPDLVQTQESEARFEFVNGNAQVSYRPSDKKTITFQGGLIRAEALTNTDGQIVIAANPGAPLTQLSTSHFDYQAYSASLEYRAEGQRPGELLTTSIQQFRFDPTSEVLTDFGAGQFLFGSDAFTRARIFKLDYVRPFSRVRRLLVGGMLSDTVDFSRQEISGTLPLGGSPFPPVSIIDGSVREAAVYASYQFPLLGGTVLGGLRVEARDYDFADATLGADASDVQFFPSVAFERRLAAWVTGNFSYSRRIAWPAIQQLSPALRFADATTAFSGNPALLPELTDAFEARFRGEVAKQTVSLTFFYRQTDNLFSNFSTLTDGGILVTRPINVGQRSDLGANLAVQGTIIRGLGYNLNANLIDRQVERESLGTFIVERGANYSANAQLDYRDGVDGRRGADRITVSATYSGPYDDGLVRRSSFFRASATWSHAITDRLSSVVTVDDIFGPTEFRTTTFAGNAITRTTNFSDGPRFKLALTYSLGRPGQPQPPTPAAPAIPLPGAS